MKKGNDRFAFLFPVGIGVGVALGAAIRNMGVGLAIGAAIGTALGLAGGHFQRRTDSSRTDTDSQ